MDFDTLFLAHWVVKMFADRILAALVGRDYRLALNRWEDDGGA